MYLFLDSCNYYMRKNLAEYLQQDFSTSFSHYLGRGQRILMIMPLFFIRRYIRYPLNLLLMLRYAMLLVLLFLLFVHSISSLKSYISVFMASDAYLPRVYQFVRRERECYYLLALTRHYRARVEIGISPES